MAPVGNVSPCTYGRCRCWPKHPLWNPIEPVQWWNPPPKEVKTNFVVTTTTNIPTGPYRPKDYVPE